ncbi:LOW QUALITY PROTEIN: syncytin-2-like [Larus michahellis]|uniref:LOW QUALITY PROTEIN: syncytin-2-like n=1 Tax=Larus michahellis TaxID=119627 RepID=UPI003D9B2FF1
MNPSWVPLKTKVSFYKGQAPPGCGNLHCNPLIITVTGTDLLVNRIYGLGAHVSERDPVGRFKIVVWKQEQNYSKEGSGTADLPIVEKWKPPNDPKVVTIKEVEDLKRTFETETGYGDTNAWVEWVKYMVRSLNQSNCYACASGRPTAQIVPFPLGWSKDSPGMWCMIALYQEETAWENETCNTLSLLFPALQSRDVKVTPVFSASTGNRTACLSWQGVNATRFLGEFNLYTETLNVTGDDAGNYSALQVPRTDLWWYCGGKILHSVLPANWKGTCGIVQLAIPFTLAFERESPHPKGNRVKGSVGVSFDERIYIDPIGVPRGVPDEHKARNQTGAGFKSVLFLVVTINKNVDWVNYIHYNQQRFINYTRDAVKGIAEQLDATSRMAWENRIALDMILAEKGGVCVMLGNRCCTFIPNDTAPDGTITKALQGLTTLADELAESSGIGTSLTGWLDSWFGKWKGRVVSILTSLIMVAGMLVAAGCCIIPCVRGLVQRLIETALTKRMEIHEAFFRDMEGDLLPFA